MDFLFDIVTIAQFTSLIPVLTGIMRFKRLPPAGKVFFYFILFSACTEGIAHLLSVLINNTMPFLYVYILVETAAYSYIFLPRLVLFADKFKPAFSGIMVLIIALLCTDLYIYSMFRYATISRIAECILIVFMGLAYILQYIQSDSTSRITRDYIFWIASGAILYFSVAFFFFTVYTILIDTNGSLARLANHFHALICIASNLLFAFCFLVIPPKQSSGKDAKEYL